MPLDYGFARNLTPTSQVRALPHRGLAVGPIAAVRDIEQRFEVSRWLVGRVDADAQAIALDPEALLLEGGAESIEAPSPLLHELGRLARRELVAGVHAAALAGVEKRRFLDPAPI
jgi:hypothetical protein